MKQVIRLLFLLLILSGCVKDKIIPDRCIPLEFPSGVQFEFFFENKMPYYAFPCFNPNNPNEISYVGANGLDTTKLYKLDLLTNEKTEIFEGVFHSVPKWSKKDWIIFQLEDFNVYKIKSNGDSLTQLTFNNNSFGPEWNKDGNLFIYLEGYTSPTNGIICADEGMPIDTIVGGGVRNSSWQHDSLIVFSNSIEVIVIDPITHNIETVYEITENRGHGGRAQWIDNENVIWAYQEGIFITNINTRVTTQIKESCDAQIYQVPNYAPQTGKVIFQRVDKFTRGENAGMAISNLYIMNTDGSEEEKIEIPE